MKEQLEKVFSNVNDWLKFAETKSASLTAANGVVLFGVLRVTKDIEFSVVSEAMIYISLVCFGLSLLFCLSSFIPSLSLPWAHKKSSVQESDNLLFFGHIENYTPKSYLNKLSKSIGVNEYCASKYEYMLASQIITNSVIASYKYSVFKKSIWLTLIGCSMVAITGLIKVSELII
ncbi:Pycsar system effector family protein [Vibrio pelagius]|uniref:Pycsar system effector family protein n=1 Tax=Vibrio pelagius TaxID=28169 RepID=UPI00354C52EF